jgi:hypothetical protein
MRLLGSYAADVNRTAVGSWNVVGGFFDFAIAFRPWAEIRRDSSDVLVQHNDDEGVVVSFAGGGK